MNDDAESRDDEGESAKAKNAKAKSSKGKRKDGKSKDAKSKSRKPKSDGKAEATDDAKDESDDAGDDSADVEENLPQSFRDFDLSPEVLARLDELNFVTPTPIQQKTIAQGLAGRDIMGKAETGTGKTLAFTLPILERIDTARAVPNAVILAPTRELAHQVAETVEQIGGPLGVKVARIVGGENQADQIMALRRGVHVLVGTPGRMIDFARSRNIQLGYCEIVCLDEADRMLDMGFIDQIQEILDKTPPERQTLLFSATFEPALKKIARRYMRDPFVAETAIGLKTVERIDQKFVKVHDDDKMKLLRMLLDVAGEDQTSIVFCNTKRDTERVGRDLWNRGYRAATLQGDYGQDVRNRIIEEFRAGEYNILVATDVAQRGLDISRIRMVFNYSIPRNPEDYVHRVGRTGRAGRDGTVLSLVSKKEWADFGKIRKIAGGEVMELPAPSDFKDWEAPSKYGFDRNRGRGGRSGGGGGGGGRGRGRPGGGGKGGRSSKARGGPPKGRRSSSGHRGG